MRRVAKPAVQILFMLVFLLISAPSAQARVITTAQNGYVGYLLDAGGVTCKRSEAGGVFRQMAGPSTWVSMAPQYAYWHQDVWGRHRFEWWNANTARWVILNRSAWQQGYLDDPPSYQGSRVAYRIESRDFSTDTAGYYRISTEYRWYLDGQGQIGRVVNKYDLNSHSVLADGPPDARVGQTAEGMPGWCYLP